MFKLIKTIFLATSLVGVTSLSAKESNHIFEKESGLITYDISGGGVITPETNLSIKAEAKLYFKDWGHESIEKESGEILTTGAIKHKQLVKRLVKETKEDITTVDYKNRQLLKRKITSKNKKINQVSCLAYIGKDTVAGFECDLFEGVGVKKCIYKDIVLKLEFNIQNISYTKVASSIEFDTNNTKDIVLPEYTLHEFSLFKDNISTKNSTKPQNFCQILKKLTDDKNQADNIENQDRVDFIKYITKDIYIKQKKLLPKLLLSMKKTRECLQTKEDPLSANRCIEDFNRLKSNLGTKEGDYIIFWDEDRKAILLDKIEEQILYLESRISCVNRAKNIIDLSSCMK